MSDLLLYDDIVWELLSDSEIVCESFIGIVFEGKIITFSYRVKFLTSIANQPETSVPELFVPGRVMLVQEVSRKSGTQMRKIYRVMRHMIHNEWIHTRGKVRKY